MFQPSDFDYQLPPQLIANSPVSPRDHSRLLLVDRNTGRLEDNHFYDLIDLLTANDVLVVNRTKVFPARLVGKKTTGGRVELLLLRQINLNTWLSISHPGLKVGQKLVFPLNLNGEVVSSDKTTGEIEIRFNLGGAGFLQLLDRIGTTPTPPYINTSAPESVVRQQYQTIYAKELGSAAAPTAGLHFTPELLSRLKQKGVQIETVTLHVGLGTFKPLTPENLKTGKLHTEYYEITAPAAARLNQAKLQGKRIIAVGTTTTRTLESNVNNSKQLTPAQSPTQLFIYPPYKFKFVDALITNFHLPQSSLLMLISAFGCAPNTPVRFTTFFDSFIGRAYHHAVENHYRFFSFGDAMFIF